ncbi:unnamed protein product [Cuscuta epithymum]|uniref:Scarecrow-like protein 14 n=1 Tax=Cuscuta epithymum TaxID=186058 RepID=A0AAV0G9T9_9ASTE|nr:unnamed protein product [Cuscuta epithymum]
MLFVCLFTHLSIGFFTFRVMDPRFNRFPDSSATECQLENEIILSTLKESQDIPDSHKDATSMTHAPTLDSRNDHDSGPALKYISQMLVDDSNIDENNYPCLFYDPNSLRAVENVFYDALHQNPSVPYQVPLFVNNKSGSLDSTFGCSGDYSTGLFSSSYRLNSIVNTKMDTSETVVLGPNVFNDTESILQFRRGVEEASRYFPSGNQLLFNIEKGHSSDSSRGKKHQHRGDVGLEEERSSKQSAVYGEDEVLELVELFDKIFLFSNNMDPPSVVEKSTQQKGRGRGKGYSKKQGGACENVDIESLLTSCAQSIAEADHRIAEEKLKKIRQYSLPTGDANQRLSHAFANALQARMDGTGAQQYAALASNKITASGMIKTYDTYISSFPITRTSFVFANTMIYEVALESKSLHIIDFGILYGFQWPLLIKNLSQRPGGPPKLRITGIELPQPGFRPEEMVQETGCFLTKYCARFGVPFKYNAITTQSWETVKLEDLKLVTGEIVAINCLYRFENLHDETVVDFDTPDFPKGAVLNLIRKINPKIYVQSVLSAAHNSPFFFTRFREALYFYAANFDMYDATLPGDDPQRLSIEESRACEIMSIVACEGMERLYRPETYKQWHLRNMRAGLKPMPVSPELVKDLRDKAEARYRKEFLFSEDGHWILQGWKGRTFCASSCWESAE